MAGRPPKMTPKLIGKLEEAFSWGCTDVQACLHADIDPSTLYDYCKENPAFSKRKETLKETPVRLARESVVRGLKKDSDLALRFLERKVKKEFSLRQELTGEDGQPLQISWKESDK